LKKAFHIILIVKSPVGFYTIHRFSVFMYTCNNVCLLFFIFFYYNVYTHKHTYHGKRTYTRSRKNDLMRLKQQTVFYGTPKHAVAAYSSYTKNFVFVLKCFIVGSQSPRPILMELLLYPCARVLVYNINTHIHIYYVLCLFLFSTIKQIHKLSPWNPIRAVARSHFFMTLLRAKWE